MTNYITGKITPLKWLLRIGSGDSIDMKNVSPNKEFEKEIPVVGGNGIMGYTEFSNTEANTLVVGRVGAHCGNIHFIREKAWVTDNALKIKLTTDILDKDFLKYSLTALELNQFANRNAQPLITGETVKSKSILLASLSEQTQIASFLDKKTAQIDKLINEKEKLLKLLAEKRTAIITQAVTKGLDPNVEMKDSGIDWLGEIPKHWEVKRVKHLSNYIGSGKTPKGGSEVYLKEGILFFRSQNIHDDGLKIDDAVFINDEIETQLPNTKTKDFDVLLNITGASLGRCNYIPKGFQRANVNQHVCIIRPGLEKIHHQYLHYSLISRIGKSQIQSLENGSSREGLSFPQIGNIRLCLPDLTIQEQVVNYLNYKTEVFKKAISNINDSINQLKEYREALIKAAVTGQIDVSNCDSCD